MGLFANTTRAVATGWLHRIMTGSPWSLALEGRSSRLEHIIDGQVPGGKGAKKGAAAASAIDLSEADDKGETPLHYAAMGGHSEALTVLLCHVKDPDVLNDKLQTPLHLAAMRCHAEAVRTLLFHGADVHAQDLESRTAVLHAVAYAALKTGGDRAPASSSACSSSVRDTNKPPAVPDVELCVDILVRAGADVHCSDANGRSPLLLCCQAGSAIAAEALLSHGCSVNDISSCDDQGRTALHLACSQASEDTELLSTQLVEVLLKHGALPNVRVVDTRQTALHMLLAALHSATPACPVEAPLEAPLLEAPLEGPAISDQPCNPFQDPPSAHAPAAGGTRGGGASGVLAARIIDVAAAVVRCGGRAHLRDGDQVSCADMLESLGQDSYR